MSDNAPPPPAAVVHIVDDDGDMRDSLTYLLRAAGLQVQVYRSASEFLALYQPDHPGCLLLDVRMPEMSGLEVYERLLKDGVRVPVIFMTAYADIPMAVRALKSGALEFLEKPFRQELLVDRLKKAIDIDVTRRIAAAKWDDLRDRLADLTIKEREVVVEVLRGVTNRLIAEKLQITERTVELRRSSILKKLQVSSTVDLVRAITEFETFSGTRISAIFEGSPAGPSQ
jgi:two-component system, LuxR family, response regulator FixJ